MTRYHRKWDRRERLLRALHKLLGQLHNANVKYGIEAGFLNQSDADRLYARLGTMANRIKRELDRG